jgi:hypothetical protein
LSALDIEVLNGKYGLASLKMIPADKRQNSSQYSTLQQFVGLLSLTAVGAE